mmetsp:Transcript_16870/g.47923  ORF Transcript_16870/g.47923 Transcript_16870/m.47923 type:complete len:154 (-) Transcript_16870:173-634(-)
MREGFVNDGMFDWSQPVSSSAANGSAERPRNPGGAADGAADASDNDAEVGEAKVDAAAEDKVKPGDQTPMAEADAQEKGKMFTSMPSNAAMVGDPTHRGSGPDVGTATRDLNNINEPEQVEGPAEGAADTGKVARRGFFASMFGCFSKSTVKQ